MNQLERYKYAVQLLKELNCPNEIIEALEVWAMFVRMDEIKLHNWEALSTNSLIEGEFRELDQPQIEIEVDKL